MRVDAEPKGGFDIFSFLIVMVSLLVLRSRLRDLAAEILVAELLLPTPVDDLETLPDLFI